MRTYRQHKSLAQDRGLRPIPLCVCFPFRSTIFPIGCLYSESAGIGFNWSLRKHPVTATLTKVSIIYDVIAKYVGNPAY